MASHIPKRTWSSVGIDDSSLVDDGHDHCQKRLRLPIKDELDAKFKYLDAKFATVDNDTKELSENLQRLDAKFDILNKNVKAMDGRVETLDAKFDKLDETLQKRHDELLGWVRKNK